jgi:dipeptidyl aminopeptidase/acylaminoacyl peptidase
MQIRFLAVLALGAAGTPALAQDPTPLIPRDVLFAGPEKASPRLSPDGKKLSFLAPAGGVLNIWVGPADKPESAKAVTADSGAGIRVYEWAGTSEDLLYLADEDGDGNWRLYRYNLTSGEETALSPGRSTEAQGSRHAVNARLHHVSAKYPRDIVVALNNRDPNAWDLYVVNIDTAELMELQRNDQGFLRFYTDEDYSVRMATRALADGGIEILAVSDEGEWTTFTKVPAEDALATGPVGFDKTGETVYMLDSRGRETAALKSINLKTQATQTLAKDRDADVSGGVLIHPTERTMQAAASAYKRRNWQVIDDAVKGDFKYLAALWDGEMSVLSRTADDAQWIVAYDTDSSPTRYYRYDRPGQRAHFLFSDRPQLQDAGLAKMHTEVIRSRDRQNLVTYYTIPTASDPRGKGRPDKPLPLVLWVHGGPWSRDAWGFSAVHQWLANRGYMVMSVNYRGSAGFGKKFVEAGNLEWGGKMHEDLLDAVEWAVSKKLADPARVAIMGGSYGGYAALVGMTMSPEIFACGIDICGPSNLATFLAQMPDPDRWAARVGDFRTEEGAALLAQRSPATHVAKIAKPLLVAQGANDPWVARSETDQMVQGLARKGVPVTYVVYADEGHGLARAQNRLSFYAVAEGFLAEHLGGRAEPVGDDFAGSTIKIPVGGQQVAGVMGTKGN